MPRNCCNPCDDPNAVTLRGGPTVLHLTNQYAGTTWSLRLKFYEAEADGVTPDLNAPLNLTGSTWTAPIRLLSTGASAGAFTVNSSAQAAGYIDLAVDLDDPVVGAGCAPTYVFEVFQTRSGKMSAPVVGDIQVGSILDALSVA